MPETSHMKSATKKKAKAAPRSRKAKETRKMSAVLAQIRSARHDLRQMFPERDSVIDGMLISILCREHIFLLGPPGTAKSLLVRLMAQLFGGTYYEILLGKFSLPEEVFGPISMAALERDLFQRVTVGKLPEAEFAVIDECLAGDTLILLPTGERRPIGELVGTEPQLLGLSHTNEVTQVSTSAFVVRTKRDPIHRIRLRNGRVLRATADHKLWARRSAPVRGQGEPWQNWGPAQWMAVQDLRPRDFVATPTKLPVFGKREIPDHHVDLLALLIADGGCTREQIRYTKIDPDMIDLARASALKAGDELVRVDDQSWRFKGSGHNVRALVQQYGINRPSVAKEIPSAIYTLPPNQLARFLAVLWSGDGRIDQENKRVSYASSSSALIEAVQHLFLRFGVPGRVFSFETSAELGGERFLAYRWEAPVWATSIFVDAIGPYAVGAKARALYEFDATFEGSDRRAQKENDIWWVRIDAIEEEDAEDAFCFTVPLLHNFIANDIVVHNCFKANSAILNSMLTIMNERLFHNGHPQPFRVPLNTMFGASNELPKSEELEALLDRMLLRYDVRYLESEANFDRMVRAPEPQLSMVLGREVLHAAQQEATRVLVTEDTIEGMKAVKRALAAQGIVASDRRWKKMLPLLRASAYLAGESSTEVDDLALLCDSLWREPKERPKIEDIVAKHCDPARARALEVLASANEMQKRLAHARREMDTGMSEPWRYKGVLDQAMREHEEQAHHLNELSRSAGKRSKQVVQDILAQVSSMRETAARERSRY